MHSFAGTKGLRYRHLPSDNRSSEASADHEQAASGQYDEGENSRGADCRQAGEAEKRSVGTDQHRKRQNCVDNAQSVVSGEDDQKGQSQKSAKVNQGATCGPIGCRTGQIGIVRDHHLHLGATSGERRPIFTQSTSLFWLEFNLIYFYLIYFYSIF